MIMAVNKRNIIQAAAVHSVAWKESHLSFCSLEFIEKHTPEQQLKYLSNKMAGGSKIYMLVEEKPIGIVSVSTSLIDKVNGDLMGTILFSGSPDTAGIKAEKPWNCDVPRLFFGTPLGFEPLRSTPCVPASQFNPLRSKNASHFAVRGSNLSEKQKCLQPFSFVHTLKLHI